MGRTLGWQARGEREPTSHRPTRRATGRNPDGIGNAVGAVAAGRNAPLSASVILGVQRLAGNQAAAAVIQHARRVSSAPAPNVAVQRNVGLEIELIQSNRTMGMALTPHENKLWKKRDVIHSADTWDLTLDDTPGDDEVDDHGNDWTKEAGNKFRKFHLEFIIHGGGDKKGFPDEKALTGLQDAVASIEAFCKIGNSTMRTEDAQGKFKNKLLVYYPTQPPQTANVQLTAGASLTGLHAVLQGAAQALRGERGGNFKQLTDIARYGNKRLMRAYVPPEDINRYYFGDRPLSEDAKKALSTMFTLIKTFLDNREEEEKESGNVKEATPLLWKTPLTLFFQSPALGPYANDLKENWSPMVLEIFGAHKGGTIFLDPKKQHSVDVTEWLELLPVRDLLTEKDKDYNASFGGLGRLEGGATTFGEAEKQTGSGGQPILEFRSLGGDFQGFKRRLATIIQTLNAINQDRGTGA